MRAKIEVHLEWQMTPQTEPSWDVQGCYITTIEGDPTIVNRHMIFPATGMPHGAWTPEYFASVGMTITGMPALNAMRPCARRSRDCSPARTFRSGPSPAGSTSGPTARSAT